MSQSILILSPPNLAEQTLQFEYYMGKPPDDSPPGTTLGWRTLPFLLLACSLSGERILERENLPVATVKKNQVILIPAGVAHKITISGSRPAFGTWCHLNYMFLGTIDIMSLLNTPNIITGSTAGLMRKTCTELVALNNTTSPPTLQSAVRTKEIGFKLLKYILGLSELLPGRADFFDRAHGLEPVFRHIKDHIAAPLNIDMLAAIACRSPSGFHRHFKDTTGKTPMEFTRDLRIRSAQTLLAGSDMQVSEVGRRVGYPDQFHFSRVFKTLCGISPAQFRSDYRREVRLV